MKIRTILALIGLALIYVSCAPATPYPNQGSSISVEVQPTIKPSPEIECVRFPNLNVWRCVDRTYHRLIYVPNGGTVIVEPLSE